MNNTSLEEMMALIEMSKKSSFQFSIFLFTIILLALILIVFLTDFFVLKMIFKISGFKLLRISSVILLLCYFFCLGKSWHYCKYGDRRPNQGPWYGASIYEAYYECTKCNSLAGGIFGKGPTKRFITDTKCVHDWQAIYKIDFEMKITAKEKWEKRQRLFEMDDWQINLDDLSPLYKAIFNKNKKTVLALISSDNINTPEEIIFYREVTLNYNRRTGAHEDATGFLEVQLTPLQFARYLKNDSMVELLLSLGAEEDMELTK